MAYMVKRLYAWVREPNRFEKPKIIGERRRILEIKITSVSAVAEKPLKRTPASMGISRNARTETAMIKTEKKEKILFTKLRSASRLFASSSMIKGIKTESDTTEATVTKIKSGMRNAA